MIKKRFYKVVVKMSMKKRISVGMTEKMMEELTELAKKKGFTKSAIISLALEDYFKKEKEKE